MTRIIEEKLDFDDVLIVPRRSTLTSRNILLERTFKFYHSSRVWNGFSLCISNMDTTGVFAIAEQLYPKKIITCLHKYYKTDDLIAYFKNGEMHNNYIRHKIPYVWISIGMDDNDIKKIQEFYNCTSYYPNICIDVANGHLDSFVNYCAKVRNEFSDSIILGGNICIPEMVQELIIHGGIDIVKVGVGSSQICRTRTVSGVGFPQLSCIIECTNVAHGLKNGDKRLGLVCSDGGCKTAGDVCKGFAANSDFVMIGGLVAGCECCEGEWTYEPEVLILNNDCPWMGGQVTGKMKKKSLKFYGMSSYEAQEKHGGIKDYRASEGEVIQVPYKGPISKIIQEIQGGLRTTCTMVGATQLKDLAKCTTFCKVRRQK